MYESKLIEIVILLGLAITILAFFRRLNLSPVLGYMAVGILIGNHGLDVIKDVESVRHFAEYGVVFLLFSIGMELTFDRLREMRLHVFGFGTLQVLLCAGILGGITYLMTGYLVPSFVIGFIISLSSSAVVLQVLADRGEQATQHGRLSLAALILQDLAFVPLLIVIPLLADKDANVLLSIGEAILHATVALVLIFIVGKKFLGPLYRMIASLRSQELFISTTLLILLGSAWFTQSYGLSLALGAFVAGLLVAETEYRTQVETDLKPFKGLLMGLFFISVGMTLDLDVLQNNVWMILTITATITVCKTFVIYALARAFGFRRSCSIKTGMILAQSSEFAFILLALALTHGIVDSETKQIFIVTVAVSMAITPLLAALSAEVARRIDITNPVHFDSEDIEMEVSDIGNHVIVVGFDNVGKTTCDLLNYKEIPYVILEDDPRSVHFGRKNGYPIFFGQCSQADNVEKLGLDRARMVAIVNPDPKETTALVKSLKKKHPEIYILARAKDRYHANDLKELGANIVIAENFESSLMIGNFILSSVGVSSAELEDAIDRFREKEYPQSQIKGISYKVKDDVQII
jgi:CPA2 family monovalent cation:H+ antiporter-2